MDKKISKKGWTIGNSFVQIAPKEDSPEAVSQGREQGMLRRGEKDPQEALRGHSQETLHRCPGQSAQAGPQQKV